MFNSSRQIVDDKTLMDYADQLLSQPEMKRISAIVHNSDQDKMRIAQFTNTILLIEIIQSNITDKKIS
jgi:hypothetical protein